MEHSSEQQQQDKQEKEITLDSIKQEVENHREEERKQGEQIQIIVFKLGEGEYAIPIDAIKEVVLTPPIARVPQTPDYVKGVANIRGNVIAIMDLMMKFNLSDESGGTDQKAVYTLVLESDQYKVGFLVREVPNTLTIYESDIDNSSNVMQFSLLKEEHISGIINVNGRLIILLNIFNMMAIENMTEITDL